MLLVIDEAQNLTLPALEEIRMLSNLETEKSKLLQIILIGQPDLRDKLDRPELEQLRQRITVSYHLEPLDADETCALHQPPAGARVDRRAAGVPARRHRPHPRAQRRRAAPDQRDRRRDAGVRLRRGAQRDRPALIDEVIADLDATGVLGPRSNPNRHESVVPADPAMAAEPDARSGAVDRHGDRDGVAAEPEHGRAAADEEAGARAGRAASRN